jgi:predicted proteasome-type protease
VQNSRKPGEADEEDSRKRAGVDRGIVPISAELLLWAQLLEPAALLTSASELISSAELIALIAHRRRRMSMVLDDMLTLIEHQTIIADRIRDELGG